MAPKRKDENISAAFVETLGSVGHLQEGHTRLSQATFKQQQQQQQHKKTFRSSRFQMLLLLLYFWWTGEGPGQISGSCGGGVVLFILTCQS